MEQSEFNNLLDRYLRGNCTAEEQSFIERWLEDHKTEPNDWTEMSKAAKAEWMAALFENIQDTIDSNNHPASTKVVKIQRSVWLRVAAAACFIGLVILGTYLGFNKEREKEVAKTEENAKTQKNDVLPGGNKAVLTLADGSMVVLEKTPNGTLAEQGGTKVIKQEGKLAYHTERKATEEIVYNTLTTPRGGQYQVELPDGTQVWLNAASSLHLPTGFAGKERRVEVSGEAYFEVAKNKNMPFIVRVHGAEVQVLGTHFNVMAYGDEAALKTTLLEGSVKFVSGRNTCMLQPGEQSQLTKDGQVKVVRGVDVNDVVAWKNGTFHFQNADIQTVMRQISLWYDVEVVYQTNNINSLFVGEMPRNSGLSDVLKALELTGNIQFKIEGKKVMVLP